MIKKFLNRMLMVFFWRVRPISKKLNPRCMKNTSAVQSIIQRLFIVRVSVVSIFNRYECDYFSVRPPLSPVRMRYASSTGVTKILPSPTSPVFAASRMAFTVLSTKSLFTTILR